MQVDKSQETPQHQAESSTEAKSTVLLGGKGIVVALVVLFLVGIGYFAAVAFNEATVRFMSIEEVVENSIVDDSKSVGVLGKLVPGSYIKSPDGVTANFRLKDEFGSTELPVSYDGEVGQVFFNDHSEIILNGTLSSDGVLRAETLTVRCPSKYLTEQEQMEIDGLLEPPPYQPDYFDSEPDA